MSKFTRALEKIQRQRDGKVHVKRAEDEVPKFHVPEEIEDRKPVWDRGIATVKDTKPETNIVTYHFPNSIITEQYRMLRTSLKNKLVNEGAQVIMVSSSMHSEGKTVTASNLAMCLSEDENVKVALIDADLRRGRVAEYLGFGKSRKGLSDLLTEDLNPKKVFLKNSRNNLMVMPRGEIKKNPSGLVNSQKMKILIAELRAHFDYVIIDSPPIMAVADPGMLAKETDGVLFIIQIGRTPKSMIAHSNQLFKQSGARILGYILTNVEYQTADYRYYSSYNYSYEDTGKKQNMRERAHTQFRRAGWGLHQAEQRFQKWWGRKDVKDEDGAKQTKEAVEEPVS